MRRKAATIALSSDCDKEIEGTKLAPTEYDCENVAKVLPNINKALQKLWNHSARSEAEDFFLTTVKTAARLERRHRQTPSKSNIDKKNTHSSAGEETRQDSCTSNIEKKPV